MKKNKLVGARKASEQLAYAQYHYRKAYAIIMEYGILTSQMNRIDCITNLVELECHLNDIGVE